MPEVRYIGLPAIVARGQAALLAVVPQVGEDLAGRAQDEAPKDTGTLAGGIHVDDVQAGGMEVKVKVATGGESSEYAIPVHEGSAPHRIEGHPFLAFNGRVVRSVNHPGAPPTKFLERPLLAMRSVYRAAIARAGAEAY